MNTLYNILVLNQLVVSGLVKVCFSILDEINDRFENIVQSHGVRNGVDSAIHPNSSKSKEDRDFKKSMSK